MARLFCLRSNIQQCAVKLLCFSSSACSNPAAPSMICASLGQQTAPGRLALAAYVMHRK